MAEANASAYIKKGRLVGESAFRFFGLSRAPCDIHRHLCSSVSSMSRFPVLLLPAFGPGPEPTLFEFGRIVSPQILM